MTTGEAASQYPIGRGTLLWLVRTGRLTRYSKPWWDMRKGNPALVDTAEIEELYDSFRPRRGDMSDERWSRRSCRPPADPEMWFATDEDTIRRAQALCQPCPIRDECLELAMRTEIDARRYGVFGGVTAEQRRAIYRERQEDKEKENAR